MISTDPMPGLTVPIRKVVYLHTARLCWPDGQTTTVTREEDISYLFTPEAWVARARDREELVVATGRGGLWARWFGLK